VIAVAVSGPESARIAADLGDGLFATEPDAELVSTWHRLGGQVTVVALSRGNSERQTAAGLPAGESRRALGVSLGHALSYLLVLLPLPGRVVVGRPAVQRPGAAA